MTRQCQRTPECRMLLDHGGDCIVVASRSDRRLRAKPGALVDRGRSAPASPELRSSTLLCDLERAIAERDRSLDVLAQLERILTMTGGYMEPSHQSWLHSARALLVELGRRQPEIIAPWVDRP